MLRLKRAVYNREKMSSDEHATYENQSKGFNIKIYTLILVPITICVIVLFYPIWNYFIYSSKLIEKKLISIEKVDNFEDTLKKLEISINSISNNNILSRLTSLESKIELTNNFIQNNSFDDILLDINKIKSDLYDKNNEEQINNFRKFIHELDLFQQDIHNFKEEIRTYYMSWKEGFYFSALATVISLFVNIIYSYVKSKIVTEEKNK